MTATSLDLSQIKTDALSSAATFRTLIGLGSSDAVTFKEATLTSGAVASSTPVIDATQTWNDGATTFTGLKLDVTDTASASNSLLMDLQVGGVTQFKIAKSGAISVKPNSGVLLSATRNLGIFDQDGHYQFKSLNNIRMELRQDYLALYAPRIYQTGSSNYTNLWCEGSNVLSQLLSTNAQTFRIYNTYTSSTSFERLNVRWNTNELIIDAEAGSGGGTLRGIKLGSATTSLLGFYGATPVDQPLTVSDPAGGGTVDTEARTAIGAIIDRLQELGLIA